MNQIIIMYKVFVFFLILFLSRSIFSQEEISLSKPLLEFSDKKLTIQYDILYSSPSDIFMVWIEVLDSKGNKINPESLSGDFGKEVRRGMNKRIIWDLGMDHLVIDEQISVEVKAEKIISPETAAEDKTTDEKTYHETKEVSKFDMILASFIMPGWGQSKASEGRRYWLTGVAHYGCLVGAAIFIWRSEYNYSILEINKADRQGITAAVLGFSATGIWLANMIWVIATPPPGEKSYLLLKDHNIRLEPYVDPSLNSMMLSFKYTF